MCGPPKSVRWRPTSQVGNGQVVNVLLELGLLVSFGAPAAADVVSGQSVCWSSRFFFPSLAIEAISSLADYRASAASVKRRVERWSRLVAFGASTFTAIFEPAPPSHPPRDTTFSKRVSSVSRCCASPAAAIVEGSAPAHARRSKERLKPISSISSVSLLARAASQTANHQPRQFFTAPPVHARRVVCRWQRA